LEDKGRVRRSVTLNNSPASIIGEVNSSGTTRMHKYRLYVYDAEDRLIAPPMPVLADNDEAAIEQSQNMLDGVRVELRDGDRLVMRHPSKE
jgi:hypothetical protein